MTKMTSRISSSSAVSVMAASMIADVERVAVYRLRQREPALSEAEAYRIVRTGLLEYERRKRRWETTSLS